MAKAAAAAIVPRPRDAKTPDEGATRRALVKGSPSHGGALGSTRFNINGTAMSGFIA